MSLTVRVPAEFRVSEGAPNPRGVNADAKDDSRRRFICIDAFDTPYYCSAEVGRLRVLQLQKLSFWNCCKTSGSSNIVIAKTQQVL